MSPNTIIIKIEGPEHSGKGHLMTLITQQLREVGLNVELQGEETHLENKMKQHISIHCSNLRCREDLKIRIMEQQTLV